MTKTTEASQLTGYRAPTEEEKTKISKVFAEHFEANASLCKYLALAAIIVTFILIFTMSRTDTKTISWASIVCALLLIVMIKASFSAMKDYEYYKKSLSEGNFNVLDGHIYKREMDSTPRPGFETVIFSTDTQIFDKPMRIRIEDYEDNMPILLVCSNDEKIYPPIVWLFSPFMLTKDAVKLYW